MLDKLPKSTILTGDMSQILKYLGDIVEQTFDISNPKSDEWSHPDIHQIRLENSKTIGIEKIHGLVNFVTTKPYSANSKVAIIHSANTMTVQAQNSLLKTLEEPPKFSYIFLVCEQSPRLLATIISRCVINSFGNTKLNSYDFDIQKFWSDSPSNQMLYLDNMTKKEERGESLQFFLQSSADFFQSQLLSNPSKSTFVLDQIINTQKKLAANCNTKLTIENLVVSVDEYKS